jgi:hypothetical protein
MRKRILGLALVTAVGWRLGALAGDSPTPLLRVPKVKTPPVIDGRITPPEYRGMAALTGMVRLKPNMVCPQVQQVTWYLGYDNEFLYLAMRSPNPPGSWPRANIKPEDAENYPINRALLEDDHVEIQIGTFGRGKAGLNGYGFFKVIVNPRGALTDTHYLNGTAGSEDLWDYGGDTRCTVDKDLWQLETKISLRALRLEEPDGKTFPIHLVRADSCGDSIYFAGWVGGGWMDWERFGEITLDPEAPAVQFLSTGELTKGELRIGFTVNNDTARDRKIEVQTTVVDGAGKEIFTQARQADIAPAKSAELTLAGALALTADGNAADIRVTDAGQDGRATVLYRVRLPITQMTDALWAKDYAPWLAGKPQTGDYKWSYAYWPSYGVIRASVDLDLFGIKEDVARAAAWSLALYPKGAAKPAAESKAKLDRRRGAMVLETGPLAAGQYEVKLRLYDERDKVLDEKTAALSRQNYPWEGNTLGKENKVIPPYVPIKADGLALSPWGRTYRVSPAGLLDQVRATGGRRGDEDILRAPISLEAVAEGRTFAVADASAQVKAATEARVDVQAKGTLAGAAVTVASYLEFDGWYHVRLTLDPGAAPKTLSRLTLTAPLWGRADTMYVQRSDALGGNRTDRIPDGQGVAWHSGQLPFYGQKWGSFVPIAFAGNGDKGLWWFAVDNRAWTMSDKLAAVEYVRQTNGVDLRINLLADTTTLDRPRTFEFAFLVTPVKPYPPDWRRIAWLNDRECYGHSTEGYRTYGTSVDGFELYRDEDYAALAAYLTNVFPVIRGGKPMVLYGSTWMCGLGLDAFDTYGGEWLGRSNWEPAPDTSYKGKKNMQGTLTFETPRQLTPLAVSHWTESWQDCFVWYHHRLFTKCPVNGTWWDNSSVGATWDYDPAAKEFYLRWNVFMRRQLTKRLATMGWDIGREPWWLINLHVDFSWSQVAWHVENDFYPRSTEGTLLDELSVDQFRALCRIKRGVIPMLHSTMAFRNVPRRQAWHQGRASTGLALLHDVGVRSTHSPEAPVHQQLLATMTNRVDFFGAAEFLPYWDNQDLVTNTSPGALISIYRDAQRAVLVVLNASDRDIPYPRIKLGNGLMGGKKDYQLRVSDAETGEGWRCADGTWFTFQERHFSFEKHGLMLLAVE